MPRHIFIVGDEDDGDAFFLVQLLKNPQDILRRARIQIARRLIREQYRRPVDQRARNGHPLLLPARKLRGLMIHPVAQSHQLQHRLAAFLGLAFRQMFRRVIERHQHILERRGPRQQIEILKDEADLGIPHHRAILRRQLGNILPIQPVFATRGPVQTAQDVHERALARPAGTHQRDHFAALHLQRNVLEHGNLQFAPVIGLLDVFEPDEFHDPPLNAG